MHEYIILQTNVPEYDRFVICLSCESLFSYIEKIEEELSLDGKDERILIDQLFLTGNGANRFLSCEFSKGKMDFEKAKNIAPEQCFRKETINWLHDHYSYVENSILTEEQKQKIRDKVAF